MEKAWFALAIVALVVVGVLGWYGAVQPKRCLAVSAASGDLTYSGNDNALVMECTR